jgi:histidinol-phosphate aminotransferase
LPGFKVYESVANFVLIKYPIVLKERLQKAFADEDYKVKFMNEGSCVRAIAAANPSTS